MTTSIEGLIAYGVGIDHETVEDASHLIPLLSAEKQRYLRSEYGIEQGTELDAGDAQAVVISFVEEKFPLLNVYANGYYSMYEDDVKSNTLVLVESTVRTVAGHGFSLVDLTLLNDPNAISEKERAQLKDFIAQAYPELEANWLFAVAGGDD